MRRILTLFIVAAALPGIAGNCGGDGSGGDPPIFERSSDGDCLPLIGKFPPGFDMLPGGAGHAVAVQFDPAAVVFTDLNGERPSLLSDDVVLGVPPDTDGDGVNDDQQPLCDANPRMRSATMGIPFGVSPDLAFVASSGYEQVMFFSSPRGAMERLLVTNPDSTPDGSYHAEDYLLLPNEGESELWTALSTKACIYLTDDAPVDPVDSRGQPIGQDACCDRIPDVPSYVTRFTAGMTRVGNRLFVATSNLYRASTGQFQPGTILIYDFESAAEPFELQPHTSKPLLFTTGFNPIGMQSYRTKAGRDLVVVTGRGAITLGVGSSGILSEGFLDFIDAETLRVVATIPLGFGAPSGDAVAIDPKRRIAMVGSTNMRVLFAADLAPLEDPRLYLGDEVIRLDGSNPNFPDARIFDAESPFEIPARNDGPNPIVCPGWTHVAINESGTNAYAIDRCDGTLSIVDLEIPDTACGPAGPKPGECCNRVPLPQACFDLQRVSNLTAPFNEPELPHAPSAIAVRPGEPGVDYTSPDVFYISDLSEGRFCSVRIDSFAP